MVKEEEERIGKDGECEKKRRIGVGVVLIWIRREEIGDKVRGSGGEGKGGTEGKREGLSEDSGIFLHLAN